MISPRRKVLVVDDSATVRAQVVQILSASYECVEAQDGRDGYDRALKERPDAVVADLEMPQMDGLGLLRALRQNPQTQTLPVVIITTVTAVEAVNQCRALGCAGFVLKPVQSEYLLAKLRRLLVTPAPA